ncbi:MAG: hypothetical protein E7572_09635 [Ruminococcaceae bacterium]|nr:hypothetical protein [Oscillospiraceae bacterium]
MDKKVIEALHQLNTALEAAADTNNVALLNAYFVMEQEVSNAAGHCGQALYWAEKSKVVHRGRAGHLI